MEYDHSRAVGDTLSKFEVQLTREGTAVNLTGMTVKFTMSDESGTIKVPESAAVVTDALNGIVQYDFTAGDVDTAGIYTGFFVTYGAGETDTYPANDVGISINIFDRSPTKTTTTGLTPDEFMELATAPRRTRTVEGTVEERSVDDLIKADRYAKSANNESVPWGIRVARTKPPGTCS